MMMASTVAAAMPSRMAPLTLRMSSTVMRKTPKTKTSVGQPLRSAADAELARDGARRRRAAREAGVDDADEGDDEADADRDRDLERRGDRVEDRRKEAGHDEDEDDDALDDDQAHEVGEGDPPPHG